MNKELCLRLLMLLSALESWSFSVGKTLPDHTRDELIALIDKLKEEVLK